MFFLLQGLYLVEGVLIPSFYMCITLAIAPVVIYKDLSHLNFLYLALVIALVRFLIKLLIARKTSILGSNLESLIKNDVLNAISLKGPIEIAKIKISPLVLTEVIDEIVPYFTHFLTSVRQVMMIPMIILMAVLIESPLQAEARDVEVEDTDHSKPKVLTKNKKTTLNIIHYNYKFKDLLPDTLAKQLKLDVDMIYALSGMPYGPYKNS